LRVNLAIEATWNGDRLVIEMRYFPALADAIIARAFRLYETPCRIKVSVTRFGKAAGGTNIFIDVKKFCYVCSVELSRLAKL